MTNTPKTRYGFPPAADPFAPFPDEVPWETGLADLSNLWLEIECECGKGLVQMPLRLMAAQAGWWTPLRTAVSKLRCEACRQRPTSVLLTNGGYKQGGQLRSHRLV